MSAQLALFGHDAPSFDAAFLDLRRYALDDTAWIEICEGWLQGEQVLFESLRLNTRWCRDRREMYERVVDVPRLTAHFTDLGADDGSRVGSDGPHPILVEMANALSARYGQSFGSISAAYYRDGRDSVALHGDRIGRDTRDCVIGIVSLGEPRRFLLKPAAGGASRSYRLGFGDLLVMGGQCQRTWLHGVPKVAHAGPRISIQFRPQRESLRP